MKEKPFDDWIYPLLWLLLLIPLSAVVRSGPELPDEAKKILDREYPGWGFGPVFFDVEKFFDSVYPGQSPNLASGDWNDDGRMDLAVRITFELNEEREYIDVALLNQDNGYELIPLGRTYEYLCCMPKGSVDYAYDLGKEITYESDAIFSGGEKSGWSWIWEDDHFVRHTTSD
jgi:hypothetical protein